MCAVKLIVFRSSTYILLSPEVDTESLWIQRLMNWYDENIFGIFWLRNFRHYLKIDPNLVYANWEFLLPRVYFIENHVCFRSSGRLLTKDENMCDEITGSSGAISHGNLFNNVWKRRYMVEWLPITSNNQSSIMKVVSLDRTSSSKFVLSPLRLSIESKNIIIVEALFIKMFFLLKV